MLRDPPVCEYYANAVRLLELARPPHSPTRSACFFAAESADFALLFASMQWKGPTNLYAVEMDLHGKGPYALVHAISRALDGGKLPSPAVDEYWSPKQEWRFYEYFGPTMKIVERLDADTFGTYAAYIRFQRDFDIAKEVASDCTDDAS